MRMLDLNKTINQLAMAVFVGMVVCRGWRMDMLREGD